jgi:hypothetical protein
VHRRVDFVKSQNHHSHPSEEDTWQGDQQFADSEFGRCRGKNSLEISEFAAKYKLRRGRDFEEFEGRMRSGVTSQKLSSEGKDVEFFGWKSLKV